MREQSPLYERFADPDFGALPESVLAQIMDLRAEFSRLLWSAWVSREHAHLCAIPAVERPAPLARARSDWKQTSEGRAAIQKLFGPTTPASAAIVHFWSPLHAVHTHAGLFLQHWDDFWYPSDDSNVLVVPHLLCLQKLGYELRTVDEDDGGAQTIWVAENADVRLSAFDPLALLGLASVWHMRGTDWSKGHEDPSLYDLLMDGEVIQPQ